MTTGGHARAATVSDVLSVGLARCPDKQAIVTRGQTYSYCELDRAACTMAAALGELGLKHGDRLAVCLPNDAEIVVLFHGAMRLGAIWVGINTVLAPAEKLALLIDCDASLFLCTEVVAAELARVRETSAARARMLVVGAGTAGEPWRQVLAAAPAEFDPVRADPYAAAAIAYTSGSSGRPKGVVQSQHNMLLPGRVLCQTRGYGPELVKGDFLPLTILNLIILGPLLTAQACGTFVAIDRRDAVGITRWLETAGVTVWNGVPAVLYDMTNNPDITPDRLVNLQDIWSGGVDCPDSLKEAFERKFGKSVNTTYGLTEAPTIVAIEQRNSQHVAGASGAVLPHLSVTVIDENGDALGPDRTGELCVGAAQSGPWQGAYRTMLGYWHLPAESDTALIGGVLHTGDLGYVDQDGQLHIKDRRSSMINRGGSKVYPAEVESVIMRLRGVSGAAVIGLHDERLGQRVAAVVSEHRAGAITPDQVQTHCRELLALYKVPEQVLVVQSLPRNAMGKVKRTELSAYFD